MTHLTTAEAAARLRVKPQTLRMWRLKGGGPPFCRVSANRCTYPEAELATWEQARIYRSTAEEHAARATTGKPVTWGSRASSAEGGDGGAGRR